ncbi:hypothetical protein ERX46_03980 [Brumimicrobium glaciale]|uniref:Uncharacterized protein n=1 Tax=Brumimicrobium glaciale TaxID=200475 RepID=A0A4Q4KMD3_9FLAO|nr:hypothetical protein [Brumimicrobium glaciale]RYM34541.1 hypothetical protein ERX46_03980 [Brumimicrobium glaciale]
MSDSSNNKSECQYCKQAVSNNNFLEIVENNNPSSFYDWKITIVFYCGLHYMKSFVASKGVRLSDHKDFNTKTLSQGDGIFPILIIDGKIRQDYINLRSLSYHVRYDGCFSDKISKVLVKGRLKDSKQYLLNVKNWIVPRLENENIETNYTF